MDNNIARAKKLLESKGYNVKEAVGKTMYGVEYRDPRTGNWIRYYSGSTAEEVETHLSQPIIGNPKKRLVQYSVTGVRKPRYKVIDVIKEVK